MSKLAAVFVASACAFAGLAFPPPAIAAPWTVVGQQGLVQFVIVPTAEATDRAAYERELAKLCEPERTCFVNFYANPDNVAPALPLPDAIAEQATAVFRRSAKQGAESFMWSCRLKQPDERCF